MGIHDPNGIHKRGEVDSARSSGGIESYETMGGGGGGITPAARPAGKPDSGGLEKLEL